jgi:ABC-type transport system substrate-binding protein
VEVEIYDYVHDNKGNKINAQDVVWCYESARKMGDWAKLNSNLKSIKATDDYHLEIIAAGIGPGIMENILSSVPIVSQAWFEKASTAERTGDPAATGPYYLKSFVAGSMVVLEQVPDFWQTDVSKRSYAQTQSLDRITYAVIIEDAQRTIALENKEVDALSVQASEMHRFQNADGSVKPGWTMLTNNNGMFIALMFNCDEKVGSPFANQKLRQAVLYALDRDAVRFGSGQTQLSSALMHDFCSDAAGDYNPKWDTEDYYDFNLDKAKQLLAESGYNPSRKIRFMLQSGSTANATGAVVQDCLAKLGMEVEILAYDQALFNTYKFDSTQWDIIQDAKGTSGSVTDAWASCFDNRGFQNGTANFVHDDKFQELLMRSIEIHDAASIDEYHYYLKEKAYAIGMYFRYSFFVGQDGITKFGRDGTNNICINASEFAANYQTVVR